MASMANVSDGRSILKESTYFLYLGVLLNPKTIYVGPGIYTANWVDWRSLNKMPGEDRFKRVRNEAHLTKGLTRGSLGNKMHLFQKKSSNQKANYPPILKEDDDTMS